MKDSIAILKNLASDPVPYVNTTVLFGLSTMEWDLLIKLLVAIPSIVWTYFRLANEIRRFRQAKLPPPDEL